MTDFDAGDEVKFAGGRGEITKIEERPNVGHLLHVYTSEGQLRKLPSGLPHIEKLDSLVDRLTASQIRRPVPLRPTRAINQSSTFAADAAPAGIVILAVISARIDLTVGIVLWVGWRRLAEG